MRIKRREVELESTIFDLVQIINKNNPTLCPSCGTHITDDCAPSCAVYKAENLIPTGNTFTADLRSLNIRPSLLALALAAEAKIRLLEYKGGWTHYTPIQCFNMLKDEAKELEEALTAQGLSTEEYRAGVLDEVCDNVIVSMMIADVSKALSYEGDSLGRAIPK
ncbi:MAG: hypothetical protein UY48_C0009G0008 [Candidatus Gottesmanbacteria bacterium GW2011_GWB1_49_7]|uniref:Uncharacterized protein n=1 Tax=Candidatus Gottesmanbacteria bacterium GW2011_GWB1_49_7 TaxID=1618448 RepID=A0A0G1W2H8_9BACT|nr:MAG: hypothetical protein UY48_C0009G0008 [Candidatus Gottesmanbacteria bacterium GW2011_GWB1_49_7]